MGMYTELNMAVKLKADTPENVINVLKYMLRDIKPKPVETPDHPLFQASGWAIMLLCDSYYFSGQTDSYLYKDDLGVCVCYSLNVRCNLKNYENQIDLFLDWLRPYIDDDGFIGYKRYEEDEDPTLIYNDKYYGVIEFKNVCQHEDVQTLKV